MRSMFVAAIMAAALSSMAADAGVQKGCPARNVPNPVRRVVLIGVDGLGARWIPWRDMPTLSRLRRNGTWHP